MALLPPQFSEEEEFFEPPQEPLPRAIHDDKVHCYPEDSHVLYCSTYCPEWRPRVVLVPFHGLVGGGHQCRRASLMRLFPVWISTV